MRRHLLASIIAVTACIVLIGCSGVTIKPGSAIILTAGYYQDYSNSKIVPCIWELNVRADLPVPGNIGKAFSMCYYNNGIYVAGYYFNGTNQVACCWVSKQSPAPGVQWTRIDLENGAAASNTTSICIYNDTVYVAGYHVDAASTPCYWTIPSLGTGQPTRTDLVSPAGGQAESIYVAGGTVYCAGQYSKDVGQWLSIPCYWVGSARTDLDAAEGDADAIYVDGSTLYVAGCCTAQCTNGYTQAACYWQIGNNGSGKPNRTIVWNEDCSEIAKALAIYVSNGTVYTAGYYTSGPIALPCYWTGTTKTLLASLNGGATGVYVNGSTVYVAGYLADVSILTPCYWRDGVIVTIDLPGTNGFYGEAHSIWGIPLTN